MAQKLITTDEGNTMTIPEMLKSIERWEFIRFRWFCRNFNQTYFFFLLQIQSRALYISRTVCSGAGKRKHLRLGRQSGRVEVLSVQSARSQSSSHPLDFAEGAHQFATQRLCALQISLAAESDEGWDGEGDYLHGWHSWAMRLCQVLGNCSEQAGAVRENHWILCEFLAGSFIIWEKTNV